MFSKVLRATFSAKVSAHLLAIAQDWSRRKASWYMLLWFLQSGFSESVGE